MRGGWNEVFPLPQHSVYAYTATPEETATTTRRGCSTPMHGEDAGHRLGGGGADRAA